MIFLILQKNEAQSLGTLPKAMSCVSGKLRVGTRKSVFSLGLSRKKRALHWVQNWRLEVGDTDGHRM